MRAKNYIPEDCHFCFKGSTTELIAEQGEGEGKPLVSLHLCKLHYEELKKYFTKEPVKK